SSSPVPPRSSCFSTPWGRGSSPLPRPPGGPGSPGLPRSADWPQWQVKEWCRCVCGTAPRGDPSTSTRSRPEGSSAGRLAAQDPPREPVAEELGDLDDDDDD